MKYCADMWYLLKNMEKDEKSAQIFRETIVGKTEIIIPTICIGELVRRYIRKGLKLKEVENF